MADDLNAYTQRTLASTHEDRAWDAIIYEGSAQALALDTPLGPQVLGLEWASHHLDHDTRVRVTVEILDGE